MENFQSKSKIYVTPDKKNHAISIVVNICVVVVILMAVASLFFDGIKIQSICTIAVSVFVSFKIKDILKLKPYYEFSIVNIEVDSEKILLNYDVGRKVILDSASIKSLEYSDKLNCIRFVGDYVINNGKDSDSYNCQEYLLYVEYKGNTQLFLCLEQNTKRNFIYMDR